MVWVCPQCWVSQSSSEVTTTEIVEPGRNSRIEFHGKIRPTWNLHRVYDSLAFDSFQDHPYLSYSCLVCGFTWDPIPPEDPTPGGSSVAFLHPVNEQSSCCVGGCVMCDRDAC